MNRRAFFPGLAGLAGCARAGRPRLNVYNWSDYVAPDTIANFEAEFGVRVRYNVFESNEEVLAKLIGGNSGYDVVFPSNYMIEPMRENGLLARLRREWLDNLANLAARFQQPAWDPRLEWSVPYMAGAAGIAYQASVTPAPASWGDLWQARFAGRITMLDDPVEVLGACLKKLGFRLNSVEPRELDLARREAIAQKKLVRAYINAEVRDQLVSGDVEAAQLWATTAQMAARGKPSLRFVYPSEGYSLYCDTMVVLRESRRQELAHRFVNYMLRPRVAAAVVEYSRTVTANARALELVSAEVRGNPALYPPADVLRRGEWLEPVPPAGQRLRDRIWTEIKSA